jgi:hypothetical protein
LFAAEKGGGKPVAGAGAANWQGAAGERR